MAGIDDKVPVLAVQAKKTGLSFTFLRILLLVALFGLLARLVISGLYLKTSEGILPIGPAAPSAQAAAAPPAVAAAAASASASVGYLTSGSMASGAAILTSATSPLLAVSADAVIPLPPADEDLRLPQRPPSAQNAGLPAPAPLAAPGAAPGTDSGTAPGSVNTGTGAGQANPGLPPNVGGQGMDQNGTRAEELSRREFELNRREAQLNAREEALKSLEADVNAKLAASERSKGELTTLIARNQAILDEQKAVREQQRKEDEELKDARIQHLVAAFKGMKPEQAGTLISSMDDMVAVSILSAMPGSNAGKILAMVTPDKAARLVKSISEQRIDPKAILEAAPQVPNS